jgi:hypothetical protein
MSGCGSSKSGQSNQYEEAAMELELEMGRGCSDLHQARCKVPLGAFLTTWRSAQRLCRGVGRPVHRGPSSTASQCHLGGGTRGRQLINGHGTNRSCRGSTLQPSIPASMLIALLPGRRHPPSCGLEMMLPRAASQTLDHLDLGHKPCAVSRRQFRQAGGVMAASFVSPVNILNVFFFLSFFFVRITEPVLEVLIYFHVKVVVPGNVRTHSSSWDRIRLQSPWAPSVPLPGRHSSHLTPIYEYVQDCHRFDG